MEILYNDKRGLFLITIINVSMIGIVIFNFSEIIKQLIGTIYLSVIPGIIIVRLLDLDNLDFLETIFFSTSLSISFLMIFGYLLNSIYYLVGDPHPLSTLNILFTISLILEILSVITYLKNNKKTVIIKFNIPSYIIFLYSILPLICILGSYYTIKYDDNAVIMYLILIVGFSLIVPSIEKHFFKSKLNILSLILIAITLLLHSTLTSKYIYGGDVHMEYHLFSITSKNMFWSTNITTDDLGYHWLNAMSSTTILPAIYHNLLNIDGNIIFKIIFPIIYSLVTIILYKIYNNAFDEKIAYFSVLFFIINSVFYSDVTYGNIRQMFAELFFIMLFYIILNDKIKGLKQFILYSIFSISITFSHYSTSYLFIFLLTGLFIVQLFLKHPFIENTQKQLSLIFVVMFSWYIYIPNSGPFKGLAQTINWISRSFITQFLVIESRGDLVMTGLGLAGISTFWHIIGRMLFYGSEFFIIIGTIYIIRNKDKVPENFRIFSILNFIILILCIVVPSFASTLNMTRFYHLTLYFLSPLFVLGGLFFIDNIIKFIGLKWDQKISLLLINIFLVIFLFFQTGLVYEYTQEESYAIPLSKDRMGLILYTGGSYLTEYDVYGSTWLGVHSITSNMSLYGDMVSSRSLASYGGFFGNEILPITNNTIISKNGVIYIGWVNIYMNTITGRQYYNYTKIEPLIMNNNKIYSSGGCQIYKK